MSDRSRYARDAELGLGQPRIALNKMAVADLRVWYRTPGGNPQLEKMDVRVKGLGNRSQLEHQLRELLPQGCRLVRWELLP